MWKHTWSVLHQLTGDEAANGPSCRLDLLYNLSPFCSWKRPGMLLSSLTPPSSNNAMFLVQGRSISLNVISANLGLISLNPFPHFNVTVNNLILPSNRNQRWKVQWSNTAVFSCCASPIHLSSVESLGSYAVAFYACQKAAPKVHFKEQLGGVTKGILISLKKVQPTARYHHLHQRETRNWVSEIKMKGENSNRT